MQIDLPDDVAQRLTQLAEQQGASIADVLEKLLDQYGTPRPGSLAEMAQNAREASISSPEPVDTAANSREILQNEYADYLKRRIDYDDHSG